MQALESHGGDLGMILALLECYDAEDGVGCDALLASIGSSRLNRAILNNCLAESLRWVNDFAD